MIDSARTPSRPAALVGAALLAALAFSAAPARAQVDPGDAIAIKVEAVTLAPGGSAEAVIRIALEPGFRILADPPPTPYTTGASLAVESSAGLVARTAVFPKPEKIKDEDGGLELSAWSGKVEVRVPIEAAAKAAAGGRTLRGRLRYQLHYAGSFYKVATRTVEIPVTIAAAKKPRGAGGKAGAATRP